MKTWRVPDPVYGRHITLIRGTFRQLQSWIKRSHPDCIDVIENEPKATVLLLRGPLAIWFSDKRRSRREDRQIVVHEVVHLATHILLTAGIGLSNQTDEAYAYYQGYLYNEIAARLGVA